MNCEVAQKKITDDLTHRFDGQVAAHLRSCSECQHLCEDLIALEELARSLRDQYEAPADFGERVLARVPKNKPFRFFGWRPILVTAAMVMLSFGFFWMSDSSAGRDGVFVAEEASVVDPADWKSAEESAYIEVVIEDPVEGEMLLHLPSVIEIRRTELHEDFYYQNTSY
jgi:hypothetical protein